MMLGIEELAALQAMKVMSTWHHFEVTNDNGLWIIGFPMGNDSAAGMGRTLAEAVLDAQRTSEEWMKNDER